MPITLVDVQDRLFGLFSDIDWWRHDRIENSFTADAVFTMCFSREDREAGRLTAEVAGREAVADTFRAGFSSLAQTHHSLSNLTARIDNDRAEVSVHMRAYHQGAGSVAHLYEESLAVGQFRLRRVGNDLLIERFDYTVLIVLGSVEVFSGLSLQEEA